MKTIKVIIISCMAIFSINSFAQDKKISPVSKETGALITDETLDMESTTLMKIGSIVPDFIVTTLEGKKIKLSELRGKTVFINFFTLSCPSCMKELPLIEKEIWSKYKDNKNIVILIVGREESIDKLIAFRNKKQFSFPMASDTDRKAYSVFAGKYVPRNIVIDKNGVLVLTEVGFPEDKSKELIQKIENELNKG